MLPQEDRHSKEEMDLPRGPAEMEKITLNTFLIVYLQELRLMASRKLQANELPKI